MTTLVYLSEGEKHFFQGSGKKPYEIKKVGGVVSCSCPAWRNLGGPIDTRVCKHIRAAIDPACLLPQAVNPVTQNMSTPAASKKVAKETKPPVLLAHVWEDENPAGWWMSEKLDGVRAWWDGETFWSRDGNEYRAPEWFKKELPAVALDGELFMGRGRFQDTVSVVRKFIPTDSEWENVRFMIFDGGWSPADTDFGNKNFEERLAWLDEEITGRRNSCAGVAEVCKQEKCIDVEHLKTYLAEVESLGGEGVMLRAAESKYESGKSKTLLKVKTFADSEAIILEHVPGKGKHKGRMGALWAKWNGLEFKIGTGFTDDVRRSPPPVGSRVTFRYQGTTRDGVPKFASFVTVRDYE